MVIHKHFDDDDDDNDGNGGGGGGGGDKNNDKISRITRGPDENTGSSLGGPGEFFKRNSTQPTLGVSKPGKLHGGKTSSMRRSVSSQIRGLERLLKNKGKSLPEKVRKAKEAHLAELQRLAGERGRRKSEFYVSKKYHMIRFFERRRLERVLQRLEQKPESPEVVSEKTQVLRDLKYVNNFPKGRKYVALFPKEGHTEESKQRVEAIRAEIDHLASHSSNTDGLVSPTEPDDNEDDFFLAADG